MLEMSMAQQFQPDQHPETFGAGRLIEKGWTVYDAVEHPIGTVTDVDAARGVITVDGRPAGLGAFEVPLDLIGSSGGNEVHLTKVIEAGSTSESTSLRLVDPPTETAAPTSTRTRPRARTGSTTGASMGTPGAATSVTGATVPMGSVTPTQPITPTFGRTVAGPNGETVAASDPTPASPISQFSPPYARQGAETPPSYSDPAWDGGDDSGGWSKKKIGMAALAMGGLAVAGYVMRRRARRKTRYERLVESASGYLGLASGYASVASDLASEFASEMARQKNPAWLGALAAAAAIPIAYYAWPSSQPTYGQQALAQADDLSSTLGAYVQGLAGRMPAVGGSSSGVAEQLRRRMPSMDDLGMPSNWPTMPSAWNQPSKWGVLSDWSMPGDWSVTPDVALPIGLLAVSALALYLARRAMVKPTVNARIGDIMTRKPRVIQPDATVADAAILMRRLDVGALPVCDGTRLIGMVTDRDITTRSTAEGKDPHLTPVRDVMSPGVAWATEDDLVEEAARIMREHRIRRLPIVDERHSLVGVVSLGDLATEVGDDEISGDTLESISE